MRYVEPIRETEWQQEFLEHFKQKSQRDYLLFLMGIHTGLRISDILPLKKKDVLGSHLNIYEKKTGKQKRIRISSMLKRELDKYTKDMRSADYLFKSQKRTLKGQYKPITRERVDQILKAAAEEIGYYETISAHSMRKTFGYNYYQKYGDVAGLMKIFNHSRETVTLVYIGIMQDDLDEKINNLYR